uniref:Uncharacterized protein n=1 Tax=Setaria digitata TaxID=48799 RepID=A0A915PWA2_9BILA
MGDKYEALGPADSAPPPPPALLGVPGNVVTPGQQHFTTPAIPRNLPISSTSTSPDRTELKSAQIGAPETKYTGAQKMCMVISGIMAIFFLMTAIAAIVVLVTGFRIFP